MALEFPPTTDVLGAGIVLHVSTSAFPAFPLLSVTGSSPHGWLLLTTTTTTTSHCPALHHHAITSQQPALNLNMCIASPLFHQSMYKHSIYLLIGICHLAKSSIHGHL
jgi:hypothetical protein